MSSLGEEANSNPPPALDVEVMSRRSISLVDDRDISVETGIGGSLRSVFSPRHRLLPRNFARVWGPPRPLLHWGENAAPRHESWMELFFDLTYVAASYNLGHLILAQLEGDVTEWCSFLVCFILHVAMADIFTCFTNYINKFDEPHVVHLLTYGWLTLCVMLMSLSLKSHDEHEAADCPGLDPGNQTVPEVWMPMAMSESDHNTTTVEYSKWVLLEDNTKHFVLPFSFANFLFFLLYMQVAYYQQETRARWIVEASKHAIVPVLWLATLLVPTDAESDIAFLIPMLWSLGLCAVRIVDIVKSRFGKDENQNSGFPTHIPHLASRMGVFVMIYLGESVIQICFFNSKDGIYKDHW
jgi:hypothetical protein